MSRSFSFRRDLRRGVRRRQRFVQVAPCVGLVVALAGAACATPVTAPAGSAAPETVRTVTSHRPAADGAVTDTTGRSGGGYIDPHI